MTSLALVIESHSGLDPESLFFMYSKPENPVSFRLPLVVLSGRPCRRECTGSTHSSPVLPRRFSKKRTLLRLITLHLQQLCFQILVLVSTRFNFPRPFDLRKGLIVPFVADQKFLL